MGRALGKDFWKKEKGEEVMLKFLLGFIVGFVFHYGILCTKRGQDACKQCWEWCQLKKKKK